MSKDSESAKSIEKEERERRAVILALRDLCRMTNSTLVTSSITFGSFAVSYEDDCVEAALAAIYNSTSFQMISGHGKKEHESDVMAAKAIIWLTNFVTGRARHDKAATIRRIHEHRQTIHTHQRSSITQSHQEVHGRRPVVSFSCPPTAALATPATPSLDNADDAVDRARSYLHAYERLCEHSLGLIQRCFGDDCNLTVVQAFKEQVCEIHNSIRPTLVSPC